jgi:hypothetical protein
MTFLQIFLKLVSYKKEFRVNRTIMRKLYAAIIIFLMASISGYAQSNKMSTKKSSDAQNIASEATTVKTTKAKAVYKPNKYHNSTKQFEKISDVTTDHSSKNASEVRKANAANSHKYKKSQSEYLNNLNSNTRYKNSKKNTGVFYIY